MDDTIASPQQRTVTDELLRTAVRYAEERHWEVFPGTWLEDVDGEPRCSCRNPGCPAPGAHATFADWPGRASSNAVTVHRMWCAQPCASILLPTGRTFDAIEVPEVAGFLALARMERMGLSLGPVLCTPTRRLVFLVLPGAAAKVPELLRHLGWIPAVLDLVVHGDGDYVAAPPTRMAGGGSVQWARRPTPENRWLPDAAELMSPLAYACSREAAAARCR